MKGPSSTLVPWDTVVFLAITTVGLGFSVQKLRSPQFQDSWGAQDSKAARGTTVLAPGRNVWDLGCLEMKVGRDRATTQDGEVRLRGRFCTLNRRAIRSLDGVKVKNLSNGYEGTVFFHGHDNSFITDRLVLVSGRNLLQLEWSDAQEGSAKEYIAEVYEK